jgi:hypothetical protein
MRLANTHQSVATVKTRERGLLSWRARDATREWLIVAYSLRDD